MDFTRLPFKPVNRPSTLQNPLTLSSLKGNPNTRFCASVDYVVSNHQLPSEFKNDYVSFLRLATQVLSAKTVTKKCRTAFQSFLSIVHTLSEDVRKSMANALIFYKPHPAISPLINQLKHSLDDIYLKEQETTKIEQIKVLERSTAITRTRGDARYPAAQFADLPLLKEFMESDEDETRLYGFNGIAHARKELKALEPRLPEGSLYEALGKGKTAYIALEKPCWKQRQEWITYCADKKALQKAKDDLEIIRADIRRFGLHSVDSAPKRRKTNKM